MIVNHTMKNGCGRAMIDKLYETYHQCRQERLTSPDFPLDVQADGKAGHRLYWEKTIAAMYMKGVEGDARFAAPLAHTQEDYGDLIIAYESMAWALIEFKKDTEDRARERDKYVLTNPEKYTKDSEKTPLAIKHEQDMFQCFVDNIGAGEAVDLPGGSKRKREPHFFIFSPPKSKKIEELDDLRGMLYWGAWANKNQPAGKTGLADIPVSPKDIPKLCARYAEFVRYAGCVKLAKSGDFTVADGEDGAGGKLVDLSLVVGLRFDEAGKALLGHVSTLEAFLAAEEKLRLRHEHQNEADAGDRPGKKLTM